MVLLVAFLDATQDVDGILDRRLIDHNRLETTLERRILLDVLMILVQCCRTDTVELSARQHWLQDVTCIERTLLIAGTDDGVQLIDEHEDLTLGLADLIEHRL